VDAILDEFRNSSDDNLSDTLLMKLAVVQNLCPAIDIGMAAVKFNQGWSI
jgi:hypothetical protein